MDAGKIAERAEELLYVFLELLADSTPWLRGISHLNLN